MAVTEQAASFGGGSCVLRTQVDNITNSIVGFDWDNTGGGDGLITITNPPLADQVIVVAAGSTDSFILGTAVTPDLNTQISFQWSTT